jgi:hypothetical protein
VSITGGAVLLVLGFLNQGQAVVWQLNEFYGWPGLASCWLEEGKGSKNVLRCRLFALLRGVHGHFRTPFLVFAIYHTVLTSDIAVSILAENIPSVNRICFLLPDKTIQFSIE